jgi:uncharacterized protein
VISREAIDDAGSRRDPSILRRVFNVAMTRTAQEYNLEALAADAGVASETASAHLHVLSTLHQLTMIPGWASSAASRAKRRPKIVSVDSGLATFALGHTLNSLADPLCHEFGQLVETYVVGELLRQAAWENRCDVFHYRDRDQREVDVVLSNGASVVGIEIKASATVDQRWGRHLTYLGERIGPKWRLDRWRESSDSHLCSLEFNGVKKGSRNEQRTNLTCASSQKSSVRSTRRSGPS